MASSYYLHAVGDSRCGVQEFIWTIQAWYLTCTLICRLGAKIKTVCKLPSSEQLPASFSSSLLLDHRSSHIYPTHVYNINALLTLHLAHDKSKLPIEHMHPR